MRILFDAYWWQDGPPSGKMVVREMVRAWKECFPEDEIHLGVPKSLETVSFLGDGIMLHRLSLRPHGLSIAFELGALAGRIRADAIVSQNFLPARKSDRYVSSVFVHDVLFQSNPEFFTKRERVYLGLIPSTIHKADVVFTSSGTEAERILRHNPKVRNVKAVGIAVGTNLLMSKAEAPPGVEKFRKYCLAVGRLNARKNLKSILDACGQTKAISPTQPLLVVGPADGKNELLDDNARRLIEKGSVRFLGHIDDRQVRWLYSNAAVLLSMSLDEGFGLPPLEALTFGCPILVSDIPVFREIYGDSAEFIDPYDTAEMADAISRYLGAESALHASVPPSGYSWRNTVHRMRSQLSEELGERA